MVHQELLWLLRYFYKCYVLVFWRVVARVLPQSHFTSYCTTCNWIETPMYWSLYPLFQLHDIAKIFYYNDRANSLVKPEVLFFVSVIYILGPQYTCTLMAWAKVSSPSWLLNLVLSLLLLKLLSTVAVVTGKPKMMAKVTSLGKAKPRDIIRA